MAAGGACKSLERSEGLGKSIAAASEQGAGGGFVAGKRKETRRERAKRKFKRMKTFAPKESGGGKENI